MHNELLKQLQHSHHFTERNKKAERRTRQVLVLTFLMMVFEIVAGTLLGSMALLADGWHMATHAGAFMITLFAYRYARLHDDDVTFTFGAGKVGVLGGFSSAIVLSIVALIMLIESGQRLLTPQIIRFDEAINVAAFGLVVNLLSALLLKDSHQHHSHDHHTHDHSCQHSHESTHAHKKMHHDHNLKGAYLHVLADALTSVLAIAALIAGKYYNLHWLDPAMGVLGGLLIVRWSQSLVMETSAVLLDQSIDDEYKKAIIHTIEADADNRVADIHIWSVAPDRFAAIIVLVSHTPQSPDYYKVLLKSFHKLAHITVEVHCCLKNDCE